MWQLVNKNSQIRHVLRMFHCSEGSRSIRNFLKRHKFTVGVRHHTAMTSRYIAISKHSQDQLINNGYFHAFPPLPSTSQLRANNYYFQLWAAKSDLQNPQVLFSLLECECARGEFGRYGGADVRQVGLNWLSLEKIFEGINIV